MIWDGLVLRVNGNEWTCCRFLAGRGASKPRVIRAVDVLILVR
jgi:hypothetical protein